MPRLFTPSSPLTFNLMHDYKISHQEAGARRSTSVVPGRARQSSARRGEICDGVRRTDTPYPLFTARSRGRLVYRWATSSEVTVFAMGVYPVYYWAVVCISLTLAC